MTFQVSKKAGNNVYNNHTQKTEIHPQNKLTVPGLSPSE